jgi:hypothetical protein
MSKSTTSYSVTSSSTAIGASPSAHSDVHTKKGAEDKSCSSHQSSTSTPSRDRLRDLSRPNVFGGLPSSSKITSADHTRFNQCVAAQQLTIYADRHPKPQPITDERLQQRVEYIAKEDPGNKAVRLMAYPRQTKRAMVLVVAYFNCVRQRVAHDVSCAAERCEITGTWNGQDVTDQPADEDTNRSNDAMPTPSAQWGRVVTDQQPFENVYTLDVPKANTVLAKICRPSLLAEPYGIADQDVADAVLYAHSDDTTWIRPKQPSEQLSVAASAREKSIRYWHT